MPDLFRLPMRMDCSGLDLVSPLDRMPKGSFAYLFNCRVIQEGRLDGRPGYVPLLQLSGGDTPNSIRVINDPTKTLAPGGAGHLFVGGGGSKLYAGNELVGYTPLDDGYSTHPLSLIPFRPDQDTSTWMYVYDKNKQVKMRLDSLIREIGVTAPSFAPDVADAVPAVTFVRAMQTLLTWAASGAASGVSSVDRTNGASATVSQIVYLSGTTGWCCIVPSTSDTSWMGERMAVNLNGSTVVVIREIHKAIPSTTVQSIQYDLGSTGKCSIVLANSPAGLARNSLISIGGETIRVEEVVLSPDGTTYSVRCTTTSTHAAADAVTGLLSWYTYTPTTIATTQTIASQYLSTAQAGAGKGVLSLAASVDNSTANFRPIDIANDYLHISIFLQTPENVTDLKLMIALDATPVLSFDSPGNCYIWTITQAELLAAGASASGWAEVIVPLSSGIRHGVDLTRTLANNTGIALQLTTTGACDWGADWWYLFGTYGPTILPNAPTGYEYSARFRDSTTGAKSVPGPLTRFEVFPLREGVIITPPTSTQDGVDEIDIFRVGGSLSEPLYIGTVGNNPGSPNSYLDSLPDDTVLSVNQPADPNALKPWPILDKPWAGHVNVRGTSITYVDGTPFNPALSGNTAVLINGQAFLTYGQPRSASFMELTQDAGSIDGAIFSVGSPLLVGQPLPFAFGALKGPFAPIIMGLGDTISSGNLYYTNFSDADTASDKNFLEITNPGDDLVSGDVWNNIAFPGTRDQIYAVRFTYLNALLSSGGGNNFQWASINAPSGYWSRWSVCACPLGVAYLGRDGIYLATDAGAVNITDEKLYPLFPHNGEPAGTTVNNGSNIILPVDMTLLDDLRLTYCDEALRFSYVDTGGNWNTLIYQIYKKRWFLDHYTDNLTLHYLVESAEDDPETTEIVTLDVTNKRVVKQGGNTDAGTPVESIVLTPSMDNGDERMQKLFMDNMVQVDGTGDMEMAQAYDGSQEFSSVFTLTCPGGVQQLLQNISGMDTGLVVRRNVAAKFSWTGGPDGPKLIAWEPSGYLQPFISKRMVTQFINLSFPGWKHHRRLFPAMVSTTDINFRIKTQDGRTYGPYTLASTNGQYRQIPVMLDQDIKDLAFQYELDGAGADFAYFPDDFVIEVKEWTEETYIRLAVFKT